MFSDLIFMVGILSLDLKLPLNASDSKNLRVWYFSCSALDSWRRLFLEEMNVWLGGGWGGELICKAIRKKVKKVVFVSL